MNWRAWHAKHAGLIQRGWLNVDEGLYEIWMALSPSSITNHSQDKCKILGNLGAPLPPRYSRIAPEFRFWIWLSIPFRDHEAQVISGKDTESRVTSPERKNGANAFFFFFLRKTMRVAFWKLFSQSSKVLPGQSKINIILLGAKEISVELMSMYTKCSHKGNVVLFFWACILVVLAVNVAHTWVLYHTCRLVFSNDPKSNFRVFHPQTQYLGFWFSLLLFVCLNWKLWQHLARVPVCNNYAMLHGCSHSSRHVITSYLLSHL